MQQQSNSNLVAAFHCKGAASLMQAPGSWVKDLLVLAFWVLWSEWAIVVKGIQFVQRLCCLSGTTMGRTLARTCFSSLRRSDSNKWLIAGEQIELWDIRGMAVIHYFIFMQRQTLFTQMVQKTHWCIARLSRSQLSELINQPCLDYPPLFCPNLEECQGVTLSATPLIKFSIILGKFNNNSSSEKITQNRRATRMDKNVVIAQYSECSITCVWFLWGPWNSPNLNAFH